MNTKQTMVVKRTTGLDGEVVSTKEIKSADTHMGRLLNVLKTLEGDK